MGGVRDSKPTGLLDLLEADRVLIELKLLDKKRGRARTIHSGGFFADAFSLQELVRDGLLYEEDQKDTAHLKSFSTAFNELSNRRGREGASWRVAVNVTDEVIAQYIELQGVDTKDDFGELFSAMKTVGLMAKNRNERPSSKQCAARWR